MYHMFTTVSSECANKRIVSMFAYMYVLNIKQLNVWNAKLEFVREFLRIRNQFGNQKLKCRNQRSN